MHTIGTDVAFRAWYYCITILRSHLTHCFYLTWLELAAGQQPEHTIRTSLGSQMAQMLQGVNATIIVGTQTDNQSSGRPEIMQIAAIPVRRINTTLRNGLTLRTNLTYSYGDAVAYD
jgi:hypothetical protein